MTRRRNPVRSLEDNIAACRISRQNWSPEYRTEAILKAAKQGRKWQLVRHRHLAKLAKNWPKGKKKSQVVLEHIARHPNGLTIDEIRQFVWEKNGYKGKAKPYYWMSMLVYPDCTYTNQRYALLPGWCELDEETKRWRLRDGEVIAPPFFKLQRHRFCTVADVIRLTGKDPRTEFPLVRGYNRFMTLQSTIGKRSVPPELRIRLGFEKATPAEVAQYCESVQDRDLAVSRLEQDVEFTLKDLGL